MNPEDFTHVPGSMRGVYIIVERRGGADRVVSAEYAGRPVPFMEVRTRMPRWLRRLLDLVLAPTKGW